MCVCLCARERKREREIVCACEQDMAVYMCFVRGGIQTWSLKYRVAKTHRMPWVAGHFSQKSR